MEPPESQGVPPAPRATPGVLVAALSVPWTRVVVYFMVVGALLVGVATAVKHKLDSARAQGFTEVEGTVVKSKLISRSQGRDAAELEVRYERAGQFHQFYPIRAIGVEGHEDFSPAQLIAQFPVGATIPVFVNPDDATDATVNREPKLGSLWGTSVLMLFAIGYVVWVDRRRLAAA